MGKGSEYANRMLTHLVYFFKSKDFSEAESQKIRLFAYLRYNRILLENPTTGAGVLTTGSIVVDVCRSAGALNCVRMGIHGALNYCVSFFVIWNL